jgi:hypothetical protein
MKTKRNRTSKNKTSKNRTSKPLFKVLKNGFPLYASKKSYGDTILEYTKEQEKKHNDSCLFENMSWFGDLERAKSYKTKDLQIYKWTIKKPTNLIIINKRNEDFFEYYFKNTKLTLKTAIDLTPDKIKRAKKLLEKENITNKYLDMTINERAHYEFNFAYGYLNVEEQYQFMKLVKFLIENKILDIKTREGSSIITKLNIKINYYYLLNKTNTKEKYNRLSIYLFDKYAVNNLCKITPKKYNIEGIYQPNNKSFWYPDLIVYRMNIAEYVLYNPHHNLNYDKIVE